MVFKLKALVMQLFFEERIEHDGGGAGIFEAADSADFLRNRGCRGDQRRAKLHAKIFRA